jgi:hypothetical protein
MSGTVVLKAGSDEDRFLLTVAYPALKPDVAVARDGKRDFAGKRAVEKACWAFALKGFRVGLNHLDADGQDAHYGEVAKVVESTVYRGPDWTLTAPDGSTQTIKAGDWLVGMILSPEMWAAYKAGEVSGVSVQGRCVRGPASPKKLAKLRN